MKAKIFKISKDEKNIEDYRREWRELIWRGSVFLYPTETIYGLGTSPFNEEAVTRIFAIKKRPIDKPLPLIASSMEAVGKAWINIPEWIMKIAERFWPGPLTIIYTASSKIPTCVHAGTHKVGIRISSNPVARTLAELAGGLFTATSANISEEHPIIDIDGADKKILEKVDVIINAGVLESQTPSTVIDFTTPSPILIRQGIIPFESIIKVA